MQGELFAEDRVVGESLEDPLAEEFLGRAIGDGYRGAIPLALDRECALAEVPQRELTRFKGDLAGPLEALVG